MNKTTSALIGIIVFAFFSDIAYGQEKKVNNQNVATVVEVEVFNFRFSPRDITINAGDNVRWLFREGGHTTTGGANCTPDGKWDSGFKFSGESFERTFSEAGAFPYHCRVTGHCPNFDMQGTITVLPVSPCLIGDANNDSMVDIKDVITQLRIVAGADPAPATEDELCRTDLDGNQTVNILDAILVSDIAIAPN